MNTFDAWNEMEKERKQRKENAPCSEWISVKDRLPEKRVRVLCKCRAGIYEVLRWTGDFWHHDYRHNYMRGFVTHWMPLPEPPEEGGGEDG